MTSILPFVEPGWIRPIGPTNSPEIAIVGEAPGEEEERLGVPFVGKSGMLLNGKLKELGYGRQYCYMTNVFLERPPNNDLENWCYSKAEVDRQWAEDGKPGKYPYAPLTTKGKYLGVSRLKALDRLKIELESVKPNLILALGNTACWALLGAKGITKQRGTFAYGPLCPGIKVLSTFHPAGVLRQWDNLPIWIADLKKALRFRDSPEIIYPKREIWIEPTIQDLYTFRDLYMKPGCVTGTDVETKAGQITCIGFSPTPHQALVIPFWNIHNKSQPNYWATKEEEVEALRFCRWVIENPEFPKVFQNGLYDIQYIWKTWGCPIGGRIDDTMIRHHAMQPELPKGLGFLGSVHTDEPAWKWIRTHKSDTEKREE